MNSEQEETLARLRLEVDVQLRQLRELLALPESIDRAAVVSIPSELLTQLEDVTTPPAARPTITPIYGVRA
jgi:hypothetical protein